VARRDDLPLRPPEHYERDYDLISQAIGKLVEAKDDLRLKGMKTANLDRIVRELEAMKRWMRESWGRPRPRD
jgi:hypothetical protein